MPAKGAPPADDEDEEDDAFQSDEEDNLEDSYIPVRQPYQPLESAVGSRQSVASTVGRLDCAAAAANAASEANMPPPATPPPVRPPRMSGTPRLDCGAAGAPEERFAASTRPTPRDRSSRLSGTPRLECAGAGLTPAVSPAVPEKTTSQAVVGFDEMVRPRRLSLEQKKAEAQEADREVGICGINECVLQ